MEQNNTNQVTQETTKPAKKTFFTEARIELIVAIFLGVTALATAWGSWVGSLHGGNQATNYTLSNSLQSDGNSEYNAATQNLIQDMSLWDSITSLYLDMVYYQSISDEESNTRCMWKLERLESNISPEFEKALSWSFENIDETTMMVPSFLDYVFEEDMTLSDGETVAPKGTTMKDSYYIKANKILAEAQDTLEQGKKDNSNGDAFGLATIIYSVVLFLLGIIGTFKRLPNRVIILFVSIIGFFVATIYMLMLPMPTGFDITSFF